MIGLLAALLPHPVATAGQAAAQEIEQRYQRAIQLYNTGRADDQEDACELFKQVEKEKPGYKQAHTYVGPACSGAEGAYRREEKLFKHGEQLFNQKRLEEAKQEFEEAHKVTVQLKHPKYRTQIEGYLKKIDKEMKENETRLEEERLYQEAMRLFNEGRDTEARDLFTKVERSGGAKGTDARNYLQVIKERHEDSTFKEAVGLFKSGDFSNSRRLFGEVIRMNGKRKGDAEDYLSRIEAAVERDRRTFDEAIRAFAEKRYSDARDGCNQLIQKGSAQAADCRMYLQRIDEALKEQAPAAVREKGQDPEQAAQQLVINAQAAMSNRQYSAALQMLEMAGSLSPTNRDARRLVTQVRELAAEEPLRAGLEAYFQGKYEEAERYLTDYLNSNNGHKRALAYFFRGAGHATRYFLSGEQDAQQKGLALADFRALQKEARQFQPPKKFVSSKILSLYANALETSAH